MSILVYIAHHQGQAKPISWEIMGQARALADKLGVPVMGCVIGHHVADVARDAVTYGADKVWLVDAPAFEPFRACASATAFQAAIAAAQPTLEQAVPLYARPLHGR